MPNEVLPISGLADVGLIEDMPSVALPPNAFSDVRNLRFRDKTIKKFPADQELKTGLSNVVYVAEWPSTLGKRYVVVRDDGTDCIFTVYDNTWSVVSSQGGTYSGVTGGEWQHTLFNGGYHIVFNNTNSTPIFLQDDVAGITELPGWDSYAVETTKLQFEYDGSASLVESIESPLTDGTKIKVIRIPRNTSASIVSEMVTVNPSANGVLPDGTLNNIGTISNVTSTGFDFTPQASTGGDVYRIVIVSDPVVSVTCGVIRSYGNLLVAGDLREAGGRVLTGTVRTSDVAAPGSIPASWNPFRNGANTADEFTLASTGIITDMAELQGVLYVYTESSIHAIQQTGSQSIPFSIGVVTSNYGCHNTGAVLEVDGKHIVYGSNDCFVFAGHPGSISSIADGRVRNFFRNDVAIKIMRFNKYDELWFWTAAGIYVFNYRNNSWTKRDLPTGATAASAGSSNLLFATSTIIKGVDHPTDYLATAYLERRRFALQTEYETETLSAIGFLVDGSGTLTANVVTTDIPGDTSIALNTAANDRVFSIDGATASYKQDIRVTGRFLNYRITHSATSSFNLSGMQLEINSGGRR